VALAALGHGARSIVDVGTGSGCLAITLASERPDVHVVAIDSSPAALAVARRNAERHGVLDRVEFVETDLLAGVPRPVDMIVANPPYVPERDRSSLAPEVRDHEPAAALFAGPDGLDTIRRLVPAAASLLVSGGLLILEFGFGQADDVTRIVAATPGLAVRRVHPDLQQIPRVVVAERA
jgi:release factor glutamine methyltransferase